MSTTRRNIRTWTWGDVIEYFQYKKSALEKSYVSRFKERAYSVVISKIKQQMDLTHKATCTEVQSLDLTEHMKTAICEVLKKQPKKYNKTLLMKLRNIPGIGPTIGQRLIEEGLKDISELQQNKWLEKLPEETRVHLQHTPEPRIPHQHMTSLEPIITAFNKAEVFMVGSYRRKTAYSSDFDIMLVSADTNILDIYLQHLQKHFDLWVYSKGIDKMSLIVHIKKQLPEPHTYKFDVFRCDPAEKYSMLLYSTGSKSFNIKMRGKAKRMGYLLNQNGIFDNGQRIPVKSEKEFFEILDMEYVEPENRV